MGEYGWVKVYANL
ncbi:hypothetical protein KEA87_05270, partial [Treponema pallidum]